eukprot:IDg901t1
MNLYPLLSPSTNPGPLITESPTVHQPSLLFIAKIARLNMKILKAILAKRTTSTSTSLPERSRETYLSQS